MAKPNRVEVPRDLASITQIDHAAEVAPEDAGLRRSAVDKVWSAVERFYATGLQPAVTLVLRRHGKIVLKRAIGHLSGNAPGEKGPLRPLSPDAPICLFSASKAISALLLHKLVEQGRVRLEDRVAEYLPEFAPHGKDRVTLRQLLAHRAGIPRVPVKDPDPSLLLDWDGIVRMLCEAKPFDPTFTKQAYHALTGGFIIGEVVRRVTGRDLRESLREWIAQPLGCRYMTFGLAPEHQPLSPRNAYTGSKRLWPVNLFARRVIGATFQRAVEISNDAAFFSSVVPAGNIYASADDACRVFQMLLNQGVLDGKRLFQPDTIEEAVRPVGPIRVDSMLMVPLRFSAGFMLGENPFGIFGPRCKHAFGHIGLLNVMCWADPHRDISVAFLNTGKTMMPSAYTRMVRLLGAIANACPPVKF